MAIVISASINKAQSEWLEETNNSPSKILQDAIDTQMAMYRVSQDAMRELQHKILRLNETIEKQRDFIEHKGLMEAFLNGN